MNILPNYFCHHGPGAAIAAFTLDPHLQQHQSHFECLGLADIANNTAIDEFTAFDLASGSKLFTATALMMLVEEKRLPLNAQVGDVLPQLKGLGGDRQITIQDLLWHTSGLEDYLRSGMYTPTEQMTSSFITQMLPEWFQQATPGLQHDYSNTNYFIISKIIEQISGCQFAQFIEQKLFAPLNLKNSFAVSGNVARTKVAKGYQNLGYGLPQFEISPDIPLDTTGDGGIYSCLHDLIIWLRALFKGEIVAPNTLEQMLKPGRLDSGEFVNYGMGLQLERNKEENIWYGHGGSWTNSTVLLGYYGIQQTFVLVLSNEFMAPVERLSQTLITQLNE